MNHVHNHFIICEFYIERKEARMRVIIEKLNVSLTLKQICEGICRGLTKYYNNTKSKEETQNNNNPTDAQESIGWQHFCRGRVHKTLTLAME